MIAIDVRLFAGLRERAGTGRLRLELPDGASAGDIWALLELGAEPPGIALAVNRAYVERDHALRDGDEVALIPPVSGGVDAPRIGIAIVDEPLDIAAVHARAGDPRGGALAAFTGTVRDATDGVEVLRLEYEVYEEMALEELGALAERAAAAHDLLAVEIAHRRGVVEVGEPSVVIVCCARHRPAALEACAELIERLKERVPIWKREVRVDGSVWVGQGS